jgi:hypothetical protein
MEEWIGPPGGELVVADYLTDIDHRLSLQRYYHPITHLHALGEGPDLAGPVLQGLGLGVRVTLGQGHLQLLALLQIRKVHVQTVPGHIDAALADKLVLELPSGTRPYQPDGHNLAPLCID